jgi:UDP-glucose 4-epimerase
VPKTVVITGAFGYVGLALTQRLKDRYRVLGVGHAPRASIPDWDIERLVGEVSDVFGRLGPDTAVIHLAGGGGERACRDDPVRATRNIVQGTLDLAEACRAAAVPRLLYASTIAVYGTYREHPEPYREDEAALPDDLYGCLKYAAETAVRLVADGTAMRIGNIYGAGSGVDVGIQGVAEKFARAASSSGEISIFGEGDQRIDFVHIDDVCRAFELALEASTLPRAINLGGGRTTSIGELARAAVRSGERRGNRPRLARKPAPEGKVWPTRALDIGLAKDTLDWTPRVPLEAGIDGLVAMMGAGMDAT